MLIKGLSNMYNMLKRRLALPFPYQRKLMFTILLYTLIPVILLGSFLYAKNWNDRVYEYVDTYGNYMKNSAQSVYNLYYTSSQKITYISMTKYVQDLLSAAYKGDLTEAMMQNQSIKDIVSAMTLDDPNERFSIYPLHDTLLKGEYIRDINNLGRPVKDTMIDSDDNSVLWEIKEDRGEQFIYLYRTVRTMEQPLAIAEIKMPFKRVKDMFAFDMPDESFIVYIPDGSSNYVIKNNKVTADSISKAVDEYRAKGRSSAFYIADIKMQTNGHNIVMFIGKQGIYSELIDSILLYILIVFMLVTLIWVSVKFVSFALTKRLYDLMERLNADVDRMIQDKGDDMAVSDEQDEFGKIGMRFNNMLQRVREYYDKYMESEKERHELEVELLQANINPHFLYNTLSWIKWVHSDKKLGMVIDSMVKYYRTALNRGEKIYTIAKELDLIREYIRVQKLAYDADFKCRIEVEPQIQECQIPKNLLQPVVENALLHGINGMGAKGEITVTGRKDGDRIVFEISDNGPGMDKDTLERILSNNYQSQYGGYGMKNVMRMIKTYYGEDYGMEVKSTAGKGTTVILTIPFS